MKTLDEVIKDLEKCITDDAIESEGFYLATDSLFYLKEYRWISENCADVLAEKYPSENVPLTWDELNYMNGKPVWVEVDGKWWGRFWAFVEVENNSYINFFQKGQEDPEDLWKRDMGKTWNAFRKERYETNYN